MTTYRASTGGTSPRLSTIVGPEVVAAILVVLVAVVGLIAVNTPAGAAAPAPSPVPSLVGAIASPTPSPVASTPSPSPAPTATPNATTIEPVTSAPTQPPSPSPSASAGVGGVVATPRPTPSPTPLPTPAPWASLASSVLAADVRVIETRDSLQTSLDLASGRAAELSKGLRVLNAHLTVALTTIRTLERNAAPVAVTGPLRAMHEAALASSLDTLRGTISDVEAYTTGTVATVATLAALEGRLRDLAIAGGLRDPYPFADPSPAP